MESKKIKKLVLKKDVISQLEQQQLKGGCATSTTCGNTGVSAGATCICTVAGQGCDFPTIGHDDGPKCLSRTDWGWCWCYGS